MNNFAHNRQQLYSNLPESSIILLFAGSLKHKSADAYYPHWTNRDFYYITGMTEPDIVFTAYRTKGVVKEILWIVDREPNMVRWIGDVIHKEEAYAISGIQDIRYIKDLSAFLGSVLTKTLYTDIYTVFSRRSLDTTPSVEEVFVQDLLKKYPFVSFHSISPSIHTLRMIKSETEIEAIEKAIHITDIGLRSIMKNLSPGKTENLMEAYFDFELKRNKVKWHAFNTIAASGKNATTLHYEENNAPLLDGDLILFDLGAQWDLYNADISRTFPINGTFSKQQASLYNIVLQANKKVIASIQPGLEFSQLQTIAKESLYEGLKQLNMVQTMEDLSEYYFHGVSHFLGLDTHDVGDTNVKLSPGMVFTVEPGLYVRELGIGIRIEDDVLVTDKGCRVLSNQIPKEIHEIDDILQQHEM
ncbi:MAG: Xaa-Pro aminopeptidase, partial [Caldisericia bacterium]|nr:Xaa-Pro aminopeptidase [Caldisericia bacterium]